MRPYAISRELENGIGTQLTSAPFVADQVSASGSGKSSGGTNVESTIGRSGLAVALSPTTVSTPSTSKCHGLPCQWFARKNDTTPLPAKIYANEGIAQVLFFQSDEACEISYKDKKGKYQAQRGVTLPKI